VEVARGEAGKITVLEIGIRVLQGRRGVVKVGVEVGAEAFMMGVESKDEA